MFWGPGGSEQGQSPPWKLIKHTIPHLQNALVDMLWSVCSPQYEIITQQYETAWFSRQMKGQKYIPEVPSVRRDFKSACLVQLLPSTKQYDEETDVWPWHSFVADGDDDSFINQDPQSHQNQGGCYNTVCGVIPNLSTRVFWSCCFVYLPSFEGGRLTPFTAHLDLKTTATDHERESACTRDHLRIVATGEFDKNVEPSF